MTAQHRWISLPRAVEMRHAERDIQFLLQRRELDVARAAAADRADDDAALFALVDQVLEGADRRVLLHANLPADDAPSVDRDELAGLIARAADHLIDRAARCRL